MSTQVAQHQQMRITVTFMIAAALFDGWVLLSATGLTAAVLVLMLMFISCAIGIMIERYHPFGPPSRPSGVPGIRVPLRLDDGWSGLRLFKDCKECGVSVLVDKGVPGPHRCADHGDIELWTDG